MEDDKGWIKTLLDEAENERMHLMTFIHIAKPTFIERIVIMIAQFIFIVTYAIIYIVSQRTAHRIVGYFEEEALPRPAPSSIIFEMLFFLNKSRAFFAE